MTDRVVLLSGMDSFISWRYLGSQDDCLYVHLSHRYAEKELHSLIEVAKTTNMDLKFYYTDWGKRERDDAYLPFRNAHLCMIAADMGYQEIVLTTQKGELELFDRSPQFMDLMTALLSGETNTCVEVSSPFENVTKQQMVKWYLNEGYDPELLLKTPGCYSDSDAFYCGACPCCFRKAIALEANGVSVEKHMPNVWKWKGIAEYVEKMKSGKYEIDRTEETKKVLEERGLW